MEKIIKQYTDKLHEMRYSPRTIEVYPSAFTQYLVYHKGRDYRHISHKEICAYLLYLVEVKKIGYSTQNTAINAIKFYYEIVLHQPRKTYYIDRPRKSETLTILLEDEEIEKLFSVCTNIKHKCIMGVPYGCGLRINEVINLKLSDIDFEGMKIQVRGGKGNQDRTVPLPDKLAVRLKEYIEKEKPIEYLFNGQKNFKGAFKMQISETSIRNILNKYAAKAGITKDVYPHLLRNNFITEHIENDTNIITIQKMAGHKASKTTAGYHRFRRDAFKNISSPLDTKNF